MIDLYTIMGDFPELREIILSYFDKYFNKYDETDFNAKHTIRQLSRSYYYLPLYEKLNIGKQSLTFLKKFLIINKIRKLHIVDNNNKLYRLPIQLFNSLEKLTIDSLNTKEFYFFCKYFSVLPINNLKINYCSCKYPDNLLQFNKLKTLDITITSKDNEELIFNLLKINKHTLQKLKIGVYTGKNIDEQLMAKIIEENLSLEFIEIRGDLFSYNMIKPRTKIIRACFEYQPTYIKSLTYLVSLEMFNIKNDDLPIIFNTLILARWIYLSGKSSNIDSVRYSEDYKYKRVIYKPWGWEPDDYEQYDYTYSNVLVKSNNLRSFYLSSFTINKFELTNPDILDHFTIADVCFLKPVCFPKVVEITIENYNMNPETFNINNFTLPKLKYLNMHRCLVTTQFVFRSVKSLNIQNSIINIDMLHTMYRHRSIKSILFYHNDWSELYDKKKLVQYLKSKRIDYYNSNDW